MSMPVISMNPRPVSAHQAMADLLESIALEETALSHILNAEGEKIQKIISMACQNQPNLLLDVNDSVANTIINVAQLEEILKGKLELIFDNMCDCVGGGPTPCPSPCGCGCNNDCPNTDTCDNNDIASDYCSKKKDNYDANADYLARNAHQTNRDVEPAKQKPCKNCTHAHMGRQAAQKPQPQQVFVPEVEKKIDEEPMEFVFDPTLAKKSECTSCGDFFADDFYTTSDFDFEDFDDDDIKCELDCDYTCCK